ncbi:MAG: MerR family transcriptional regulator [Dermatophilaceae bacterium]
MLSIGEFARLAGVSVRMLRHYDRLGLLTPARVDAFTGYRRYAADQLERADRLVALKDLGFTLEQVGRILDDQLDARQWRSLLEARADELRAAIVADTSRLQAVEARLSALREENSMSHSDFHTKALPALELAAVVAQVGESDNVGDVVGPLFDRLVQTLATTGTQRRGPDIGYYSGDGETLTAAAAAQVAPDSVPDGLTAVALPAVPRALVTTWTGGEISGIQQGWQALVREVEARELTGVGPCREVYLRTPFDGGSAWVVELQQPLG